MASVLTQAQLGQLASILNRGMTKYRQTERRMIAKCNEIGEKGKQFAKANHPWQNRTGKAHKSLNGFHVEYANGFHTARIGYLGDATHDGVPYGFWLEVRWSGKYQILTTTMRAMQAEFIEAVQNAAREEWS